MRFVPIARFALVLLPLLVCAGRIHAHRSGGMDGMTREVNRCLTVVRVAATRRRGRLEQERKERDRKPRAAEGFKPASSSRLPAAGEISV
jgi:hypothetical protein